MEKKPVIAVVGPTASGKTGLSIEIAKQFHGEVVSADSMQIYQKLNIGTAKPTKEEMGDIPHHFIDFLSPDQSFNVADYVKLAHETIAQIHERGNVPVVAGGTGLYVSSLLNNIQFAETKSDENLRQSLFSYAERNGEAALYAELKKIDSEGAESIHPNNIPRVVRAIEIYRLTGIPMSQHQKESRLLPTPYHSIKIGLNYHSREVLYQRINKRVDLMIEKGLLEEAKEVLSSEYASTAMQAIGYKELAPYFCDMISLEEAVENLKRESRRYAKRQLTWFRRDSEIFWVYPDEEKDMQKMQKKINIYIEKKLDMCYD